VLDADVGDQSSGATTSYSAEGLQSGSDWDLILRSTPQVIASGVVPETGVIQGVATIPDGLESGWHSITLSGTDINGQTLEAVVWFQVDAAGLILEISSTEPEEEVVTPTPVTPAAAAPASAAPPVKLATTGANLEWLLVAGLLAVIAGSGFVAFSRRKRIW
jgi:LPXTG-motif cell wall-anchored protein